MALKRCKQCAAAGAGRGWNPRDAGRRFAPHFDQTAQFWRMVLPILCLDVMLDRRAPPKIPRAKPIGIA
jgi:hypothetical protein